MRDQVCLRFVEASSNCIGFAYQFYNGNPQMERATIIMRLAPTFLRFGSFEIFKPTDKFTGRAGPRCASLHSIL